MPLKRSVGLEKGGRKGQKEVDQGQAHKGHALSHAPSKPPCLFANLEKCNKKERR